MSRFTGAVDDTPQAYINRYEIFVEALIILDGLWPLQLSSLHSFPHKVDERKVKTGRRTINNLRYADDANLLADNSCDLKQLLKKVKEENAKAGLYLESKE